MKTIKISVIMSLALLFSVVVSAQRGRGYYNNQHKPYKHYNYNRSYGYVTFGSRYGYRTA